VDRAGRLLTELAEAHLVEEHRPGRYTHHDLLRAYAAELVEAREPPARRRQAVHRLLDHYLHTAHNADQHLQRSLDPVTPDPPGPGVSPERLSDPASAWAWLGAERPVLVGAVRLAAAYGFDTHVWQLAAKLGEFLDKYGHWDDWLDTQHAALAATQRLADTRGQARVHRVLGYACSQLGRHDEAKTHLNSAHRLFEQLGDKTGQAHTHINLNVILEQNGEFAAAIQHAKQAHRLFGSIGNQAGQAYALNNIGWCQAHLGDHRAALTACRQAAELFEQIGNPHGQAATLDSLGYVHRLLGEHRRAAACYERAIGLYRDIGDTTNEADTYLHLGEVHEEAGDTGAAQRAWRSALTLLDELDHPDAGKVRARLTRQPHSQRDR
jgi:tetratricopeptide (TPR) repeat protein